MLRVRLNLLLLITAHLPLVCAGLSQTEETSSMSARLKGNPDSCGKDCEDHRRIQKRSTSGDKCELYYFVPTAKQGETFSFWNNTKAEQLEAYLKVRSFMLTNPHEEKAIFFPAHLPLVEKRNGSEVLVLLDVYVRAKGTCGWPHQGWSDYYDTNPAWYKDADQRLQEELKMLEDYIQLMPRSHFGYRAPNDGEEDVCLDETGLVVKEFPNIRTCFSMWIFDYADPTPKYFAGRQIYNRINQQQHVNISAIGFNPSEGLLVADPISTDMLSLPALFLKEMCESVFQAREAYRKIIAFLWQNPHEENAIFFPAHLPLVEKRNGSEVLVLLDVYVRAKGKCGQPSSGWSDYYDTNPAWYRNADLRLQTELRMLEDYIELVPRSHFGYRVPTDGEDVCLDETGLVVKEFPNIRTCFSMWIFDNADQKPKHFAGRQIYNRINQEQHVNISAIRFNPSEGVPDAEPVGTEMFSLPALFLKEMCDVTNKSLPNRCTYWASDRFYVSLCCCYTNRTECAYRKYKFPAEKKEGDPVIRACATGGYYPMKDFGGNREPKNASESSVKEFVQERTSSEFCKWTYTWNPSNNTRLEDALRVDLDAAAAVVDWMQDCVDDGNSACCHPTTTLCPMEQIEHSDPIVVECVCVDGDLCNKRHSYVDKGLVRKFEKARPCEAQSAYVYLLSMAGDYRKPHTNWTHGYMCPVFYNFAYAARKDMFLQLVARNNLELFDDEDTELFQQDGCNLVEVTITEDGDCPEKLFGEHESTDKRLLILLCSVEGNPLGEPRTSYPDTGLKKTIDRNLTVAKEAFATCKNGSWSLDFESISELVMDNSKLEHMFNGIPNGTNDNITTVHCFVEVNFAYQHHYNFTFGAVSIDDRPLFDSCHESEKSQKCVQRNSAADGEHQHLACCCHRRWNKPQDDCQKLLLGQLKALLNENAIAQKPQDIMTELKRDPLTKCFDAEKTHEGQVGTDINRPCARNEGCYSGAHARDVSTSTQHKKFGGCVSKDAPDAKKRDDATNDEVEARFYRICRLSENEGQCFAVLGTEDPELPGDVKGPQMVCCCKGQVATTHKCGSSHKMGAKIGDLV